LVIHDTLIIPQKKTAVLLFGKIAAFFLGDFFYNPFLFYILLLTNAGRCATIKVSKDRIYHSLSAVFGHKSQVSWVSWLPADEIDFSALLFSAGLFILHF